MVDSVTQILNSGPPGTKRNIAVLGDGFAEADQTTYNNKVKELLLDGVFGHDYFYEDMQAFNIYRVNLISNESGVSKRVYDEHGTPNDPSDDTIVSTTMKDTALRYIYNGSWIHFWIDDSADTLSRVRDVLNTWVPNRHLVVIILNETGWGGKAWDGHQVVTLGGPWNVMAHEFGHAAGDLADEYCRSRTWTFGEPSRSNATVNTNLATIKWNKFINNTTPIPTGLGSCAGYNQGTRPPGWSDSQDVGLFEGGSTYDRGVFRPVINCRMRENWPPYCPICYTQLKTRMHAYTGHSFLKCYTGDFNGDGKDDLLVHNGNSILIYRSDGAKLDLIFSAVLFVPGSWYFQPNDQFYVGDFNGDGKDEVLIYNNLDWAIEILGLLMDDGSNGLRLVVRYDDGMPGWPFQRSDKFYLGDFDGDAKKDLFIFNGNQWAIPYLAMIKSNGSSLSIVQRYDGNIPGWRMKPQDRHYVGDFDGDGKDDLFVFNGRGWAIAYLGMMRSSGSDLSMTKRYDGNISRWQMRKNDNYYVSDVNGDGKYDLFAFNFVDWSHKYFGCMVSSGNALLPFLKEDRIGEWILGFDDMFEPCDYEGLPGKRDLIVHKQDWLGMIRTDPSSDLILSKIYYKWIHNYKYGRNW